MASPTLRFRPRARRPGPNSPQLPSCPRARPSNPARSFPPETSAPPSAPKGLFVPDPDSPAGHTVPTDLAVQVDEKLLHLGIGYNDVAPVVRLNANGTVDTTFGQGRLAHSGFGPYQSDGLALAVGPQAEIAAAANFNWMRMTT